MKILFLTGEFPPYTWGGLGRYSYETYLELRKISSVDVLQIPAYFNFLSNRIKRSEQIDTDGKNTIIRSLSTGKIVNKFLSSISLPSQTDYDLFFSRLKYHQALHDKYDILYVQDYYNALIAEHLYSKHIIKKIVFGCHLPLYSGFTYFDKPLLDEIHFLLEALIVRIADAIIVPSFFTKRVLSQIYSKSDDDIFVNPLGVNLNGQDRKTNNLKSLNLITVARITEQKGLNYTLAVLSELKKRKMEFHYHFVGQGPKENQFFTMIKKYNLSQDISYYRQADDLKLKSLYSQADIYLSTSVFETFGLTVLEAMSFGCISIAYKDRALCELIVDETNGFLCNYGDTDQMVSIMEKLLKYPELKRRISCNAEKDAAKYTWERHAKKLFGIFMKLNHGN